MANEVSGTFISLQSALIGRYSLERELGRGGMGIVYLAHDVALDRPVALKLLPPDLAARPNLRERFLREARTAARLSHPNIVPIFSVDEVGEFVFFVMAFINGETLGQRVRGKGPLPPSDAARLVREVAWALAYAHAQGVVHRDVKPDNILLEAGSGRALVADFGIAHLASAVAVTGAHEVLGTAEYISPEQAAGEPADGRSDIYSLGVVAYYAVSGTLPFQGRTVQALLAQHITQPPPRAMSVAPGLPRRMGHAIDRCLEKSREARFASGEQLAEALTSSLEARREAPAPLRLFIKRMREYAGGISVVAGTWVALTPFAVVTIFDLSPAALPTIGLWALLSGGTLLTFLKPLRALQSAGFTREDLLTAWKADMEREREERALEWGVSPRWFETTSRALAWVSLGGALLALGAGMFAVFPAARDVVGPLLGTSLLGALMALSRRSQRTDLTGRWFGKLWESRFGRWLFKTARIALKSVAPQGGVTYRRTELAIGMGIDNLFESLPRSSRQHLGDLPAVVRGLEADAMRMRERIEDLTAALDRTHDQATERELREAREAAQTRQTEAVTALEGIRLNLLRLTAGVGSVDSLTQDLAVAREVSEGVDRLLEGQREVASLQSPDPAPQVPVKPRRKSFLGFTGRTPEPES